MKVYQCVIKLNTQEIADFVDPKNYVSRILVAHFLAIQMIVAPIIDREWSHRIRPTPILTNVDWINSIREGIRLDLRRHLEWPVSITRRIFNELNGRQLPPQELSILRKRQGLSKDFI